MIVSRRKHKSIKNIIVYSTALLIFIFTIFPFYWIFATSIRDNRDVFQFPPSLFPRSFVVQNYINIFTKYDMGKNLINSLICTLPSTIIATVIAFMGAYALSRLNFKGKGFINRGLVFTQMFPGIVRLVPLYMMIASIGLYNTHFSLILTYLSILTPVSMLLMNNYFSDIPKEMDEAAVIDGCSRIKLLIKIITPLAIPGVIATSIFGFVTVWQELMFAQSFLMNAENITFPVRLTLFKSEIETDWGATMASSVVLAIPVMILFSVIQNYFINALAGGVKE
jgi:ABC-type glycerol-3-phosphate transport system permease component